MNFRFFCLLFLIQLSLFSQTTITGKVVDKNNNPLLGASIYINNSTIGTTSDDEGMFQLKLKEGIYDLIVSFVGFKTIQYKLDTKSYRKTTFKLLSSGIYLDEVVISKKKKKISKETRAYYLKRFKRHFLGKGELSKYCDIVNENVIDFDFNNKTRTLEASAAKPLQIKNKALGYFVYYDLVHFELTPTKVYYLGYSRYKELKGSKRKKKRWQKQRRKAFLGSKTHFYQALTQNNLKKAGYEVDLYRREKNPLRPSRKEILAAREYLRLSGNSYNIIPRTYQKTMLITKLDTVKDILSRARLKEFQDVLIEKNPKQDAFLKFENDNMYLNYSNVLKVKYLKEAEEKNYRQGDAKLPYQVTNVLLLKKPAKLFREGSLEDPFSVFYDGYFGFEKVAYQLPLDYNYK